MTRRPHFCPACQAIPQAGYCRLAGCPTAPSEAARPSDVHVEGPGMPSENSEKRKQVARIIDPSIWACADVGSVPSTKQDSFDNRYWLSLTKADAILATESVEGVSPICRGDCSGADAQPIGRPNAR